MKHRPRVELKQAREEAGPQRVWSVCERKVRYPTRRDAKRASRARPLLSPYQCPFCDGFHLTHGGGGAR